MPLHLLSWHYTSFTILLYHGLYGSTSCCISHGPSQWERSSRITREIGQFSTFVRKITLILDIPSIPFWWVNTRIPFDHPAQNPSSHSNSGSPTPGQGRYTRAVSHHHVVCIMYDIPFLWVTHPHSMCTIPMPSRLTRLLQKQSTSRHYYHQSV